MVTWFGPGSGMSISSITNGPPCSTCMAALLFMTVSPRFDQAPDHTCPDSCLEKHIRWAGAGRGTGKNRTVPAHQTHEDSRHRGQGATSCILALVVRVTH